VDSESFDLATARRALLQGLESLERAGVTHLPRPPLVAAGPKMPVSPPQTPLSQSNRPPEALAVAASVASGVIAGGGPATADKETLRSKETLPMRETRTTPATPLFKSGDAPRVPPAECPAALQAVAREVAACTACRELATTRTQTVFGVGNPQARLCFLGEAPGADEDRQGEPFVGRAGQLLDKIIEACTMRREEVYILNTLKCRPPGNRNPLPDELSNCRGFLDRQLEIIRPEFICCLGAVAARALLAKEAPIGRLRKQFFEHRGAQVICTYHPAYLLRNPAAKKDVWEDMQLLMREMGVKLPGKS